MALILVTGAAGFIGANVARAFARAGHQVVGSDRLRQGGKWRNLLGTSLHDLVSPDVLPEWLCQHADHVELVVHLGAVSATTETDVDRIIRDNVRLSLDLWEWCAQSRVRLVYASSAATYGTGSLGFDDVQESEALSRLRPLNAYGWSKQMVDCRIAADVEAGRTVPPQWAGLKFFNVYGPGEDHKGEMRSLVNKMMPIVREGGSVKLFRSYDEGYVDGGQMRDFVYVDDVVDVVRWLASSPHVSGLFNVGSGQARTWNDLAGAVFSCLGRAPSIEYVEMPEHIRRHYQYFTQAPIGKLRAAGWNGSMTSLEDGVRAYVEAVG